MAGDWVGQEFHLRVILWHETPPVTSKPLWIHWEARGCRCAWWQVVCDYADLTSSEFVEIYLINDSKYWWIQGYHLVCYDQENLYWCPMIYSYLPWFELLPDTYIERAKCVCHCLYSAYQLMRLHRLELSTLTFIEEDLRQHQTKITMDHPLIAEAKAHRWRWNTNWTMLQSDFCLI